MVTTNDLVCLGCLGKATTHTCNRHLQEYTCNVYTLPVVDDDGEITGKRGKVIVPSKQILLVDDLEKAAIGNCAIVKQEVPHGFHDYRSITGKLFERRLVTDRPNPRGKLKAEECTILDVWIRRR